jgi:membrane protease YdiL (CAAX protease family)
MSTPLHFIIFSILLAVIPAFSEELFFRGVFINGLKGVGTILACFFSGLFFALYHCSASQFIYQFIYGFVLALLTVKSGSVIPSIVAHFINNFSVLAFYYFGVNVPLKNPIVYFSGLALIIFSVSIMLFAPKLKKQDKAKDRAIGVLLPFGFIGVIACVGLILGNLFI